MNTGPDQWTVILEDSNALAFTAGGVGWQEPEDVVNSNVLTSGTGELFVSSDATFLGTNMNGQMATIAGVTGPSTDLRPSTFTITFTDNAVVPETPMVVGGVPDTGTTASLFGFSLAGLTFLRRKLG